MPKASDGMSTPHLHRAAYAVAVFFLAVIPFLPALGGDFVWDDHELIENNVTLDVPWTSFGRMVSFGGLRSPYYRPLSILFLSFERALFGCRPAGFHAANILLHAVAALLLLALARRVLPPLPAFVAAAIFAVHPVHIEPVAFISAGATELLPSLLFLGALVIVLAPRLEEGAGDTPGSGLLWGAAGLYLLSLFAKEVSIGLPVIVGAVLARQAAGRGGRRQPLRHLAPFAAVLAVYAALRLQAMWRPDQLPAADIFKPAAWTVIPWALTAGRLLLAPVRLLPYYELEPLGAAGVVAGVFLIGVAAAAVALLARERRWDAAVTLGAGLFLVPLLPALPLLPRSGALISERYLYLPSAGLALLLAAALDLLLTRRPALARSALAATAAILACAALWSGLRSLDWRNDVRLFTRAAARAPRNSGLQFLLGDVLARAGRHGEAEEPLARALSLSPRFVRAQTRLADVYRVTGRLVEARRLYRQSIDAAPEDSSAHFGLGSLEMDHGDPLVAAVELETAVRLSPDFASALVNLGVLAYRAGRIAEAESFWRQAVVVEPRNALALGNLGAIARSRARDAEARGFFEQAPAADSRNAAARKSP